MRRVTCMVAALSLFSVGAWASMPRNTPRTLKASPTATGAITGRVVDQNGAPLGGFFILIVTAADRGCCLDGQTGADGTYTVSGLADGSYFVDAYNPRENRHVDTWYPNVWDTDFWRNLAPATPVVVSNGGTATANFTLPIAARILLTLKDPSGAPIMVPPRRTGLPGCWGAMYVLSNGQPYEVNGACTGGRAFGDGTYEPYGVPIGRTYLLEAWPAGFPYVPVFYDNKLSLETATPIPLTAEGPLPIAIQMRSAGHVIAGKYTFSTPQDQVVSGVVVLMGADGTALQNLDLPTNGTYSLQGLADGDYVVELRVTAAKGGVRATYTKFYRNAADFASATRISVNGSDVTGIDVVMDTPADAATLKSATSSVSLVAPSGASSDSISIPIWTDSGSISWTASGMSSWIRITPSSGTVTANQGAKSIVVSADGSNLSPGSFGDTLTINGNVGATLGIPVSLQVTPAPLPSQSPVQVSSDFLSFVGETSQFAPLTLTLKNPGTVPLTWLLRSPLIQSYPSSGTLAGGAQTDVTIAANSTGVEFGSVTGTMDVITNGQVTGVVRLNLTVAPKPVAAGRGALSIPVPGDLSPNSVPSVALVLPSIGSNLPGAGGSLWSSDVFMTNLPSLLKTNPTSFIFTPFGSTNGSNSLLVTGPISAPMTTLSSPIATLFRQSSGFGAMELRPGAPIASWSRIWTFSADHRGTYGQEVPAVDAQGTIGSGESGTIPVVLGGTSFRTNLLISEVRGIATDVTVAIRNSSGDLIKTQVISLGPFEQKSVNNILFDSSVSTAYATVGVSGGAVGVLASIVDNSTNDPTTVMATKSSARTASGKLIVPGLVHAPGAGNTTWRSDVWIVNTSSEAVAFQPLLYQGGGAASLIGKTYTVPAGAQVTMSDSILSDFNLNSGKGALLLNVTSGDTSALRMFSRTFNVNSSGGTLGQGILPVRDSEEIRLNDTGLTIFGLQRSRGFRTNLQIQETGGASVSVQISGEGTPPGTTISTSFPSTTVNLGAYDLLQFSDILGLLGFPVDTINARIVLRVVSGTGSVTAYGSLVDNITGDATTVPAFRLQQ